MATGSDRFVRIRSPLLRAMVDWKDPETPGILRRRRATLAIIAAVSAALVILARTDLPGATRVAEALRAGVERVGQRLGFGHGAVTVSIGISEYDPTLVSEGNPLADADEAMYRAKASGRNMVAEGGLTHTSDER